MRPRTHRSTERIAALSSTAKIEIGVRVASRRSKAVSREVGNLSSELQAMLLVGAVDSGAGEVDAACVAFAAGSPRRQNTAGTQCTSPGARSAVQGSQFS